MLHGPDTVHAVVRFSPDGTRLVASSKDRTVRLWDTATGKELLVFRGGTAAIRSRRAGKTIGGKAGPQPRLTGALSGQEGI
jgi:WD40 repeat protein